MPIKLPVYQLSPAPTDPAAIEDIAAVLFGLEGGELEERDGSIVGRSGSVAIELSTRSAAASGLPTHSSCETRRCVRRSCRPSAPTRPRQSGSNASACSRASTTARPSRSRSSTRAARSWPIATASRRTGHALDVQARYGVAVRNPGIDGEPDLLPVVGGGGKFALPLGDEGRPIASRAVASRRRGRVVEAIDPGRPTPASRADVAPRLRVRDLVPRLPRGADGSGRRADSGLRLWRHDVVGGKVPDAPRHAPCDRVRPGAHPTPAAAPAQEAARAAQPASPRRGWRTSGNPFEAGTRGSVRRAASPVATTTRRASSTDWPRTAGSSTSTGATRTPGNPTGGGTTTPGWTPQISSSTPDTRTRRLGTGVARRRFPDFNEVGAAPPRPATSGANRTSSGLSSPPAVRCRTNSSAAGGGDVLTRWDGAFDGLHTLMGYGAITFDNTDEGKRIVKYARGVAGIDAWFRTAREIEPGTNGAAAPDWTGRMGGRNVGNEVRSEPSVGSSS